LTFCARHLAVVQTLSCLSPSGNGGEASFDSNVSLFQAQGLSGEW
jgi:hypothetical protein